MALVVYAYTGTTCPYGGVFDRVETVGSRSFHGFYDHMARLCIFHPDGGYAALFSAQLSEKGGGAVIGFWCLV